MPERDLDAHLAQHSTSRRYAGSEQWLQEPPLEGDAEKRLSDVLHDVRCRLLKAALVLGGADVPISRKLLDEAYESVVPSGPDADWAILNRRRIRLIQREISGVLSESERVELDQLQAYADQYVAATAPRPLEALRDLEQRLTRKDGAEGSGTTPSDR